MEDLERIISLMRYAASHENFYGVETLERVVLNKEPMSDDSTFHIDGAMEAIRFILDTLFDIEPRTGKPQMWVNATPTPDGWLVLTGESLANELAELRDRFINYYDQSISGG